MKRSSRGTGAIVEIPLWQSLDSNLRGQFQVGSLTGAVAS